MEKLELRITSAAVATVSRNGSLSHDGAGTIEGHAAIFRALAEGLPFRERILPGAFTRRLLAKPDVRALFNHDPNNLLGQTASGTLRLEEDARGLKFRVHLPNTESGRTVYELTKRGDLSGASFGFRVREDRWVTENGGKVRELVEIDLAGGDISPCVYPAYSQTSVEARSHFEEQYRSIGTYAARPEPYRSLFSRPVSELTMEELDLEEEHLRAHVRNRQRFYGGAE